jgi:hypothetical protein
MSNKAVTKTDQTYKGILKICIPGTLILITVVIILIEPRIEEIPAKCKLKIAKSTDTPEWYFILLNGGYTVQPVPTPDSNKEELNKSKKLKASNQKLILFNLGKAISGAPIRIGTNQFPKPLIKTGITKKKIIIKA